MKSIYISYIFELLFKISYTWDPPPTSTDVQRGMSKPYTNAICGDAIYNSKRLSKQCNTVRHCHSTFELFVLCCFVHLPYSKY